MNVQDSASSSTQLVTRNPYQGSSYAIFNHPFVYLCEEQNLHSPTWINITTEETQNWTSPFISVRLPNVGLPKFLKCYIILDRHLRYHLCNGLKSLCNTPFRTTASLANTTFSWRELFVIPWQLSWEKGKLLYFEWSPTMTFQNSQVRFYVSLIGSGEGRHTTHLLTCVLLLSTSLTDWKQSSDVLSDISFDILSGISSHILSDISFDILSDISSDILSDISFDILSDISSDRSSDILSDISFDMLSDISSDILSDISKTKHSIHSFTQKPLHKLYICLKPRSKSNIHDNFVSVKWQFYSCIRLHRTAPPKSSWVQRCKAPVATHTPHASDSPPKKQLSPKMPRKWAHRRNYISWRVQTMKSDPCHCGSCLSSV